MPTRKSKKRGAAGSRRKTSRAGKVVPSKRKKPSAKKKPSRKRRPAKATKKVAAKKAHAKRAKARNTTARRGKQTVTRKAGAAIAHAVTTVRKVLVAAATGAATGAVTGAVHGVKTAVTPDASPTELAGSDESGARTDDETGH